MNRYKSGGPSEASVSTLCQKCLKRGHYSYECTASQQERPYTSRPSRTQQLLNPKLAPKITNLPEAKPTAAEAGEVGKSTTVTHGRNPGIEEPTKPSSDPQRRSISASSSDSVSTISTNRSRSQSPPDKSSSYRNKGRPLRNERHDRIDKAARRTSSANGGSSDRSPPARSTGRDLGRYKSRSPPRRSRSSSSSVERPTRSGSLKNQRFRSRSPYHEPRTRGRRSSSINAGHPKDRRERSISPYSRRMMATKGVKDA